MSSKKEPEASNRPKSAFSRRGFLGGVGVGGGVLGSGLLAPEEALAQSGKTSGPGPVSFSLKINGQVKSLTVEPRTTLCDALRNHLDLTGAKRVCDRGTCGACTVIMSGRVVYSCTVLAIDAQGKDIQTIEDISAGGRLHPVSAAFVQHDAQQCGYCTPGFVMAAHGFLKEHPNPTEADVKTGLCGNLCRCGTYMGVRKAVVQAGVAMKGGSNG